MVAKVILNPYSGRWGAERRFPEAASALEKASVEFEVAYSEEKGHCETLAEEAARDGFSPIIAAGGDGTIGEVVNGMMKGSSSSDSPPLGVLPLGTANDFVANLKMPTDLREAVAVIAAGKTRAIDLCKVNDRYFVNNTALGIEPLVTVIQEEISFLKGVLRYLYATLSAIVKCTSWDAKMTWDDGSYEGPLTLVSGGNGPRTGGLFYMTPHADLFDGKLTFSYGYAKSRLRMLGLLPLIMKEDEGSFVEEEDFHEINTTHLSVSLQQPSPAHADGEIFDREVYEAEYSIIPQGLSLLMP